MQSNGSPMRASKKIIGFAVTAISICAFSHAALAAGRPAPAKLGDLEDTDQIIVKYKKTDNVEVSEERAKENLTPLRKHVAAALKHERMGSNGVQILSLDYKLLPMQVEAIARELSKNPLVEYAEPDYRMYAQSTTPNDPSYSAQWHYFDSIGGVNLPLAWDRSKGAGVVIAIIDTGIRPHADLKPNILPGYDFISSITNSNDFDGRDANPEDPGNWQEIGDCGTDINGAKVPAAFVASTWHGTHVAGTAAAVTNNNLGVAGVAGGALILPVRALGKCGGATSDTVDGMRWAAGISVAGVPNNATPARVINLSLAGPAASCPTTLQSAINDVRAKGVTVVVIAGNGFDGAGVDASTMSPANCAGVLTVASTTRYGGEAPYSGYGSSVTLSAPGGDTSLFLYDGILSTSNSGSRDPLSDTYGYKSGTSMAAPQVSGVVALLYALMPTITPELVKNMLTSSVRPFPSVRLPNFQCTTADCGAGILDAAGAVANIVKLTPITPTTPTTPAKPSLVWLPAVLSLILN